MYYVLSAKSAMKLNYKIKAIQEDYVVKIEKFSAAPGLFSVVLDVTEQQVYYQPENLGVNAFGYAYGLNTKAKKPLSDLLKTQP